MKFTEYWAAFCLKAATKGVDMLAPNEQVVYTTEGLKRQLKGAFEQGQKQGHMEGFSLGYETGKESKKLEQLKQQERKGPISFDDMFKSFFGGTH
jgi:flagellar biosynthesis/type III secretory pathway protein FliH